MEKLWSNRLTRVQEEIAKYSTKPNADLIALESEIRHIALNDLKTHSFYLSKGGKESYLQQLDSWFRDLIPGQDE